MTRPRRDRRRGSRGARAGPARRRRGSRRRRSRRASAPGRRPSQAKYARCIWLVYSTTARPPGRHLRPAPSPRRDGRRGSRRTRAAHRATDAARRDRRARPHPPTRRRTPSRGRPRRERAQPPSGGGGDLEAPSSQACSSSSRSRRASNWSPSVGCSETTATSMPGAVEQGEPLLEPVRARSRPGTSFGEHELVAVEVRRRGPPRERIDERRRPQVLVDVERPSSPRR